MTELGNHHSASLLGRLGFVTRTFYDYVLGRFGVKNSDQVIKKLHEKESGKIESKTLRFFDPAGYFYTAAGSSYARHAISVEELKKALQDLKVNISSKSKLNGLEVFFIQPEKTSKQIFTLFSGMRSCTYYKIPGIRKFIEKGIPILIGDYRGTGASYGETEINKNTLVEDGIRILEEQLKKSQKIGAVGHSLGTAIISKSLAEISTNKNQKISCHLVLVSAWDVFSEIFSKFPGFLAKPFGWVLRFLSNKIFGDTWDTGDNLCRTIDNLVQYLEEHPHEDSKLKIDLVHGDKDSIVSINQGRALEAKLKNKIASLNPKLQHRFEVNFHVLNGGGHFHEFEGPNQLPWDKILELCLS